MPGPAGEVLFGPPGWSAVLVADGSGDEEDVDDDVDDEGEGASATPELPGEVVWPVSLLTRYAVPPPIASTATTAAATTALRRRPGAAPGSGVRSVPVVLSVTVFRLPPVSAGSFRAGSSMGRGTPSLGSRYAGLSRRSRTSR
jgi:hypothetical protein